MNYLLPYFFLAFSLPSCLSSTLSVSEYKYLISELVGMNFSETNLIDSFYRLKGFYNKVQNLIGTVKGENLKICTEFHSTLTKYYMVASKYYTESPTECIQFVRLYGNIEFIYFFYSIISKSGIPAFHFTKEVLKKLNKPGNLNSKSKRLGPSIVENYENIAKGILYRSFKNSKRNNSFNIDNQCTSEDCNGAVADWDTRKGALQEIILSLRGAYKFSMRLKDGRLSEKIKQDIACYQFLIKEFQIDSEGPKYDHFLYVFHNLRLLAQKMTYENCPQYTISNWIAIFRVHCWHLTDAQLTDLVGFSKFSLSLIACWPMENEQFFQLLKFSADEASLKALEYVKSTLLSDASYHKRLTCLNKRLGGSSHDSFKSASGLFSNLLNTEHRLKPWDRRIVQVILRLVHLRRINLGHKK